MATLPRKNIIIFRDDLKMILCVEWGRINTSELGGTTMRDKGPFNCSLKVKYYQAPVFAYLVQQLLALLGEVMGSGWK